MWLRKGFNTHTLTVLLEHRQLLCLLLRRLPCRLQAGQQSMYPLHIHIITLLHVFPRFLTRHGGRYICTEKVELGCEVESLEVLHTIVRLRGGRGGGGSGAER